MVIAYNADISNIRNGEFLFCKELNKGFIKRDITSLGVSTFSEVADIIESMDVDVLVQYGFDSVKFLEGSIDTSVKVIKQVQKDIEDLPIGFSQAEIDEIIERRRNTSKYFNQL